MMAVGIQNIYIHNLIIQIAIIAGWKVFTSDEKFPRVDSCGAEPTL